MDLLRPGVRMDQEALLKRVTLNPRVMAGKPVLRQTRVPVGLIVRMVAQGVTREEILQDYPRLEPDDIQAALLYAAAVVAGEEVFALPAGAD
jgi:uncharacterized protein (DUF433 family)